MCYYSNFLIIRFICLGPYDIFEGKHSNPYVVSGVVCVESLQALYVKRFPMLIVSSALSLVYCYLDKVRVYK